MPIFIISRFLKNNLIYCFIFLLLCLYANISYAAIQENDNSVADLENIPQNVSYFLPENPHTLLVSEEESKAMYERFKSNFFMAWEHKKASVTKKEIQMYFDRKGSERGYAENYLPWDNERWNAMVTNANIATYPNTMQNAIVIKNANVREMPTNSPRFEDPTKAGDGYPFDLFQYTTMPIGQPVAVVHISLDKAWYYVQAAHISGWIEASNVSIVDKDFTNRWKKVPLIAFVEDGISLIYKDTYVDTASIGTVLPVLNGRVHIPLVQPFTGKTHIVPVSVSENSYVKLPMRLTANNIALLADKMLGQPYGWGGLFGNRDCSAMLRDLFITFGMWLPRNSFAQSYLGSYTMLEDMTNEEKIEIIKEQATPFLSLIYLPGHIGLYLGEYKGEPVFLHDVWGVRAKNEGRIIIGKTVITSLDPAKENARADRDLSFINRIIRLNTLGQNNE